MQKYSRKPFTRGDCVVIVDATTARSRPKTIETAEQIQQKASFIDLSTEGTAAKSLFDNVEQINDSERKERSCRAWGTVVRGEGEQETDTTAIEVVVWKKGRDLLVGRRERTTCHPDSLRMVSKETFWKHCKKPYMTQSRHYLTRQTTSCGGDDSAPISLIASHTRHIDQLIEKTDTKRKTVVLDATCDGGYRLGGAKTKLGILSSYSPCTRDPPDPFIEVRDKLQGMAHLKVFKGNKSTSASITSGNTTLPPTSKIEPIVLEEKIPCQEHHERRNRELAVQQRRTVAKLQAEFTSRRAVLLKSLTGSGIHSLPQHLDRDEEGVLQGFSNGVFTVTVPGCATPCNFILRGLSYPFATTLDEVGRLIASMSPSTVCFRAERAVPPNTLIGDIFAHKLSMSAKLLTAGLATLSSEGLGDAALQGYQDKALKNGHGLWSSGFKFTQVQQQQQQQRQQQEAVESEAGLRQPQQEQKHNMTPLFDEFFGSNAYVEMCRLK
eukprot:TRINITY_DN20104_c0_g1_i1.p1 TRINITY_DN20104_c0_g1~~TRINITY_DN20104_c0_g1_i1.p1  ORF type:complete len:509 (+),score=93.22 TRINITY_DN20104_c0_g1_i1:44-1528(+)